MVSTSVAQGGGGDRGVRGGVQQRLQGQKHVHVGQLKRLHGCHFSGLGGMPRLGMGGRVGHMLQWQKERQRLRGTAPCGCAARNAPAGLRELRREGGIVGHVVVPLASDPAISGFSRQQGRMHSWVRSFACGASPFSRDECTAGSIDFAEAAKAD